ncbi:FAD dependent oxidoreductase [Mycena metata]|uniref:FAD dependent oxidoreductase n=1 Tax=Mycena metata TaxID=1033252 RepID=A0AAD7K7W4_9AGAR|nr:FAD dependent oxidoreductase [Mycena metata]
MTSWKTAFAFASLFPATLALQVCTEIQQAVSVASAVYYPCGNLTLEFEACGTEDQRPLSAASGVCSPCPGNYDANNAHWVASSTQDAACTVEPATAADVSAIIKLLGKTRTPFAVKSGGHATNPGYSSTPGVQISLTRFNAIKYDKNKETVVLGAGLIWDDVYAELEPLGVVAPGGRVPGVGVAGFTLGGGYNWISNGVGLTVDIVLEYQLVTPKGDIESVTAKSNPDLFFALSGAGNNFGIVTQFTFKAFPLGQVWGGLLIHEAADIAEFNTAFANFAVKTTDPKASIVSGFALDGSGNPIAANIMFYDGPEPPAGVFDEFLAIKNISSDISARTLTSLVASAPQTLPPGTRGYFNTLSFFEYTPAILDALLNETKFWGPRVAEVEAGALAGYHMEPFLPTLYTHNSSDTAWPFLRSESQRFVPLQMQFTWDSPKHDTIMREFMEQSAAHLTHVANEDGQPIQQLPLYPNYGLFSSPPERIYGTNLPRLLAIKAKVDPQDVMGLAGGWKLW